MIKKISTIWIKLLKTIPGLDYRRFSLWRVLLMREREDELGSRIADAAEVRIKPLDDEFRDFKPEHWSYRNDLLPGLMAHNIYRLLARFFQRLYFTLRYHAFSIYNTRIVFFWRHTFPKYSWWKKLLILMYVIFQFILFYVFAYYFTALVSVVLFEPVIKNIATKKYNPMWHKGTSKLFEKFFLEHAWGGVLLKDKQIPRLVPYRGYFDPTVTGVPLEEDYFYSLKPRIKALFNLDIIAPVAPDPLNKSYFESIKPRGKPLFDYDFETVLEDQAEREWAEDAKRGLADVKGYAFRQLYVRPATKIFANDYYDKFGTDLGLKFKRREAKRLYRERVQSFVAWLHIPYPDYRRPFPFGYPHHLRKFHIIPDHINPFDRKWSLHAWFKKKLWYIPDQMYRAKQVQKHHLLSPVRRRAYIRKKYPYWSYAETKKLGGEVPKEYLQYTQGQRRMFRTLPYKKHWLAFQDAKYRLWLNLTWQQMLRKTLFTQAPFNVDMDHAPTRVKFFDTERSLSWDKRIPVFKKFILNSKAYVPLTDHGTLGAYSGPSSWQDRAALTRRGYYFTDALKRIGFQQHLLDRFGLHEGGVYSAWHESPDVGSSRRRRMLRHMRRIRRNRKLDITYVFRRKKSMKRRFMRYKQYWRHPANLGNQSYFFNVSMTPVRRKFNTVRRKFKTNMDTMAADQYYLRRYAQHQFLYNKRFGHSSFSVKPLPSFRHLSWDVLTNGGYIVESGFKRALPAHIINPTYLPEHWNAEFDGSFHAVTKQDFNSKKYLFNLLFHNNKIMKQQRLSSLHAPVLSRLRLSKKKKYFFVPHGVIFDPSSFAPFNPFRRNRKVSKMYVTKASRYQGPAALRYLHLLHDNKPSFLGQYWTEGELIESEWFDNVNYPMPRFIRGRKQRYRKQRFTFKYSVASGGIAKDPALVTAEKFAPGYLDLIKKDMKYYFKPSVLQGKKLKLTANWPTNFATKAEHPAFGRIYNNQMSNFYKKFYKTYSTAYAPMRFQFYNYNKMDIQSGDVESIIPQEAQGALISHFMQVTPLSITPKQAQMLYNAQSNLEISAWWNRARLDRVLRGKRVVMRAQAAIGANRRVFRRKNAFFSSRKWSTYLIYPSMKSRASASYSKWWPIAVSQHKMRQKDFLSAENQVLFKVYPSLYHYVRFSLEDYRSKIKRNSYKKYSYLLSGVLKKYRKLNVRATEKFAYERLYGLNWQSVETMLPVADWRKKMPKLAVRNKKTKKSKYLTIFPITRGHGDYGYQKLVGRWRVGIKKKIKKIKRVPWLQSYLNARFRWDRYDLYGGNSLDIRLYNRAFFVALDPFVRVVRWDNVEGSFKIGSTTHTLRRVQQTKVPRLFAVSGQRFSWLARLAHSKFREFWGGWGFIYDTVSFGAYFGFYLAILFYIVFWVPFSLYFFYFTYKDIEIMTTSFRYALRRGRTDLFLNYAFVQKQRAKDRKFAYRHIDCKYLRYSEMFVAQRCWLDDPIYTGNEMPAFEKAKRTHMEYLMTDAHLEEEFHRFTPTTKRVLKLIWISPGKVLWLSAGEDIWYEILTEEVQEMFGFGPDCYKWFTQAYFWTVKKIRYNKTYGRVPLQYWKARTILKLRPYFPFVVPMTHIYLAVRLIVEWIYVWVTLIVEDLILHVYTLFAFATTPTYLRYWYPEDDGDIMTLPYAEDAIFAFAAVVVAFFIHYAISDPLSHNDTTMNYIVVNDAYIAFVEEEDDDDNEIDPSVEEIEEIEWEETTMHAQEFYLEWDHNEWLMFEGVAPLKDDDHTPYETYIWMWEEDDMSDFNFALPLEDEDNVLAVRAKDERIVQEMTFHGHLEFNVHFSYYLTTYKSVYYILYTDLMQGDEWLDPSGQRQPWHHKPAGVGLAEYKSGFMLRWTMWEEPHDRGHENARGEVIIILGEGKRLLSEHVEAVNENSIVDIFEEDVVVTSEDCLFDYKAAEFLATYYIPTEEPLYILPPDYDEKGRERVRKQNRVGEEMGSDELFTIIAREKKDMSYDFNFTFLPNEQFYDLNNLELSYSEVNRKKQIILLHTLVQKYPNKSFEELLLLVYRQYKVLLQRQYADGSVIQEDIVVKITPADEVEYFINDTEEVKIAYTDNVKAEETKYVPLHYDRPIFTELQLLEVEGGYCKAEDLLLLYLILRDHVVAQRQVCEVLTVHVTGVALTKLVEQKQKEKLYQEYLKYKICQKL